MVTSVIPFTKKYPMLGIFQMVFISYFRSN